MARQWMTHDCFCNMETHVAGQVGQKKIQFQCSEGDFIGIEFCQNDQALKLDNTSKEI